MITATNVAFIFLSVALFLTFYRLVRGPRALDRVVALELTSMIVAGFILVDSAQSESTVSIDVAIIVAVVGFLSTVTFAYFLERGRRA